MTVHARSVSAAELSALTQLARSRTRGAGLVRRAQALRHTMQNDLGAPEIATRMGLSRKCVRFWLKRFNEQGVAGLHEAMRSGRPPTYTAEERGTVITTALTAPGELGLPFACWTLDRLVVYLGERGVGMRRSRISEILLAEGLKWRREETWFGERVDPDFPRKRGRLSNSTPPPPAAAS